MAEIRNIPFTDVEINGGFWKHRQEMNRETTIYTVLNRFMDTGRFEAFNVNWREGDPNRPHIFWDSDIAKWMESVAYILEKHPAPDLEKIVEETIDKIEANQCADGYFNIYFTAIEPSKRWQLRSQHELYCAGHLMEAAVAWKHATGRDRFLKIMCKYADYIDRVFRQEGSAAFTTPGHEEIELALVKLYHATGEKKYLDLSQFFINQRGNNDKDKNHPDCPAGFYQQDHLPCAEQTTAEGHSVRTCYLYAGMADIARECQDPALQKACETLFDNIVQRRMYITAGIGSTHIGEAFTVDYDLPNQTAYTETCASIALAYFAQRMLLLDPNAKYADIVERVLYNGFLASTSLDGRRFYYSNPMEIDTLPRKTIYGNRCRDWLPESQRVEVFGCSCCPPNITRFIASIGDYLYSASEDRLYIHQYVDSSAKIGGAEVEMHTDFPISGAVSLCIRGWKGRKLCIRIPHWSANFGINQSHTIEKGYAVIDCTDDEMHVDFTLDMSPTLIEANPHVSEIADKVALMRGPVVYCLEGIDNGERLFDCAIDPRLECEIINSDEYHMPLITAKGWQRPAPEGEWLYRPYSAKFIEKTLRFIPYYAMMNRGECDMRVWLPVRCG